MYLEEVKGADELSLWVKNANEAFRSRSNDRIPYAEIKAEGFFDEPGKRVFGLLNDEKELIGGMCIVSSKKRRVRNGKNKNPMGYARASKQRSGHILNKSSGKNCVRRRSADTPAGCG